MFFCFIHKRGAPPLFLCYNRDVPLFKIPDQMIFQRDSIIARYDERTTIFIKRGFPESD